MHLRNEDFADHILGILQKYEIDGKYIEVELTEVSDFDDSVAMQKFIDIMRKNNIGVAIDDFGTGYSTLNVLKDYNISVVKIDKSLLNNIGKANSHDEITSLPKVWKPRNRPITWKESTAAVPRDSCSTSPWSATISRSA